MDLSGNELKVLEKWKTHNVPKNSEKVRREEKEFYFTEGPAFANGSLHFGHFLQSFIKDSMNRHRSLHGETPVKTYGVDCHGIPITSKVDKMYNLNTKEDIENFGLKKYNERCRSYVKENLDGFTTQLERIGRWIGDHRYQTMSDSFMESVWWAFKEIHNKGLIYEGYKVMPYSIGCFCTLSQSEAKQNYKRVQDPAITVKFKVVDSDKYLLAFTTTPWTLPSNLAITVNPNIDYVEAKTEDGIYIVAKSCLSVFKKIKYTILNEYKGKKLESTRYEPLFPYFQERKAFFVICDDFVKNSEGTGLVHTAPGFGIDDFNACLKAGIIKRDGVGIVMPMDEKGCFNSEVKDYDGKFFKDCDKQIIKTLKERGLIFKHDTIMHDYPFCYRTDTPIMYKICKSWFFDVTKIKGDIIRNNKNTNFVPIKNKKRFLDYVNNAIDWSISRNRVWGIQMPIFQYKDELKVFGSQQELEEMCNTKIEGLHREFIVDLKVPSTKYPGVFMTLVPYTLDCWFDSASVPFAQYHYPFENRVLFEKMFPIQFIAEANEQVSLWFYNMSILATALFDKPAFKNVICSGMVMDPNGRKFSKKEKNYPDSNELLKEYGSDALRMFLLNSNLTKGENINYSKDAIKIITKGTSLFWINSVKFCMEYYTRFKKEGHELRFINSDNIMDKWIISTTGSMMKYVKEEMDNYRIYNAVPKVLRHIDKISKWYINMNRPRIKGFADVEDWNISLSTLYRVLVAYTITMSSFAPFLADSLYDQLKVAFDNSSLSVHYCKAPKLKEFPYDEKIELKMARAMKVITMTRFLRSQEGMNQKMCLRKLIVGHSDDMFLKDVHEMKDIIQSQTTSLDIEFVKDEKYISYIACPNKKSVGKKFGKDTRKVISIIEKMSENTILGLKQKGSVYVSDFKIEMDDIVIKTKIDTDMKGSVEDGILVLIDPMQDRETKELYHARVLSTEIQQMRKEAGLHVWDIISIYYSTDDSFLNEMIESQREYIKDKVMYYLLPMDSRNGCFNKELDINGKSITVKLVKEEV
jgi:isoleucyl-tRNA synthetase